MAGVSCNQRKTELRLAKLRGVSSEGDVNSQLGLKPSGRTRIQVRLPLPAFLKPSGQIPSHATSTWSFSTSLLRKCLEKNDKISILCVPTTISSQR